MGHAETGSGKTAAFMLPMINKIMNSKVDVAVNGNGRKQCTPIAIVIAPTRELILQIYEQGRKFADSKFFFFFMFDKFNFLFRTFVIRINYTKIFYNNLFLETNVQVAKAYGLYKVAENIRELYAGCDILCATPGRLKMFLNNNIVSFFYLNLSSYF